MDTDKEVPREMPESSMAFENERTLDNQYNVSEISTDNQSRTSDKSNCSDAMEDETPSVDDTIIYNGSINEDCAMESNADSIAATDDLRQFDVLDDLERHPDQNGSDMDSDTNESMDSDVPDEEIEAMLEEGKFQYHKTEMYRGIRSFAISILYLSHRYTIL